MSLVVKVVIFFSAGAGLMTVCEVLKRRSRGYESARIRIGLAVAGFVMLAVGSLLLLDCVSLGDDCLLR